MVSCKETNYGPLHLPLWIQVNFLKINKNSLTTFLTLYIVLCLHYNGVVCRSVLTTDHYVWHSGCKTQKKRKKSFMFDGAHIWNSLPTEIRESNSIISFETKIATRIFKYSHFWIVLLLLYLYIYIYIYIYFLLYVISYTISL